MDTAQIVIIITSSVGVVGTIVANVVSNKPKREDSINNRVDSIFREQEKIRDYYKGQAENCEKRVTRLTQENRTLRQKLRNKKE